MVEALYNRFLQITNDPGAAATLVLAEVLSNKEETSQEPNRDAAYEAIFCERHPVTHERIRQVYVAEAVDADRVKIGIADNAATRVSAIGTSCPFPLSLVCYAKGTVTQERQLHKYFSSVNVPGAGKEWFYRCSSIQKLIEYINTNHELPVDLTVLGAVSR